MKWNKDKVENFFGIELIPSGENDSNSVLFAYFKSQGLDYELIFDTKDGMVGLFVKNWEPGFPFPIIEISFKCTEIDFTEAQGIGPVMLFYPQNSINLETANFCITKSKEYGFSISVGYNE